jgi:hypothetical protein
MNLRAGDSVSAIAKVVASRGAAEDDGRDELALEEIAGTDGLSEPSENGSTNGEGPLG